MDHSESATSIHVAGMNRDMAKGVSTEKTLDFIEKSYKKGMSREQLQILDQYGFVVKAFQGGRTSVSFDPRLVKGRIYTHNHPGKWGGTFSDADISSLSAGGREMRASAAEGVYSLKATKKANAGGLYTQLVRDMPNIDRRMQQASRRVSRMRIVNPGRRATVDRRLQLSVLNRWYWKNAGKFGYQFQFVRDKSYKI